MRDPRWDGWTDVTPLDDLGPHRAPPPRWDRDMPRGTARETRNQQPKRRTRAQREKDRPS